MQKSRYWCFTLNNPTLFDETYAFSLTELPDFKYACWQHEISPTTQTQHLQGFVCLKKDHVLSYVNECLESRAHLEPKVPKSTLEQARDYCRKEDTRDPAFPEFYEIGEFPEKTPGKRTDLEELHSRLQSRTLSQAQYAEEFFADFRQYPNLLTNYIAATIPQRDPSTAHECLLIYGPPGTGKSRLAGVLAGRDVYRHSVGKWFDGYRGESVLYFDDFRGSSLSFTDFKRVIDRHPLRVEVKGSSCQLATTKTIISTNYLPEEWYSQEVTGPNLSAIIRRIDLVIWAPEPNLFYQFFSYSDFARAIAPVRVLAHDGLVFQAPQFPVLPAPWEEEVLP
uniref:Replication-associated protein n=1 Tax=Red panda feces-associated circular DNA virus 1 TaxID=2863962 RepID=A0A8K1HKM9_9VIRU|nr:replicase [Red panda feces-associated circular DNA virus 1]